LSSSRSRSARMPGLHRPQCNVMWHIDAKLSTDTSAWRESVFGASRGFSITALLSAPTLDSLTTVGVNTIRLRSTRAAIPIAAHEQRLSAPIDGGEDEAIDSDGKKKRQEGKEG